MNLETMTYEELEAYNRELMAQKDAIRAEQLRVNAVITQRLAEQRITEKLAAMSDAEKEAMKAALGGA